MLEQIINDEMYNEAYGKGFSDYHLGWTLLENPYPFADSLFIAWGDGWYDAFDEDEMEH